MSGLVLALGGGGAKGAFQLGCWEAFREMGLEFDAIAGTSIGSVNAAFMASSDYTGAVDLWENLKMDQCLAFSENRQVRSSDLISLKNAEILARELFSRRSLNTDPMRMLLNRYLDEERIRSGRIDFGLMTATLPALRPTPYWVGDIPQGSLIDYIMASTCLPGLKKVEIDGKRHVDGGLAENVPISMLKNRGFRRIVAIDLSEHGALRTPLIDNIQLTYIHDRQDLGGTLDITQKTIARNRRLGYLAALKAFDRLAGDWYAFDRKNYALLLSRFGAQTQLGLEQAAIAYEIDRQPVYEADRFLDLIRQKRRQFAADYIRLRQMLQIDHKIAAVMSGRLKVLNLLPPMRLAFLMEMMARAKKNESRLMLPMHLFRNLDLAAQALLLIDGDESEH